MSIIIIAQTYFGLFLIVDRIYFIIRPLYAQLYLSYKAYITKSITYTRISNTFSI